MICPPPGYDNVGEQEKPLSKTGWSALSIAAVAVGSLLLANHFGFLKDRKRITSRDYLPTQHGRGDVRKLSRIRVKR